MAGCVRACVRGEMSAHGILRYLAAAAGGGGADARITNMALTLRRSRHVARPRRLSSPPSTDI